MPILMPFAPVEKKVNKSEVSAHIKDSRCRQGHSFIRKTFPCNETPLKPNFNIVKLGFAGVYLFFLFLLQNIDCGYC